MHGYRIFMATWFSTLYLRVAQRCFVQLGWTEGSSGAANLGVGQGSPQRHHLFLQRHGELVVRRQLLALSLLARDVRLNRRTARGTGTANQRVGRKQPQDSDHRVGMREERQRNQNDRDVA